MSLLSQSGKKYDWLNDKTVRDEDQDQLDYLANLYKKTKEQKYKEQWYELVKKIVRHIPS
tara:strand:- start:401 stop:580 length:180 start_codon:yes stop_codon:yes gene_type:complete